MGLCCWKIDLRGGVLDNSDKCEYCNCPETWHLGYAYGKNHIQYSIAIKRYKHTNTHAVYWVILVPGIFFAFQIYDRIISWPTEQHKTKILLVQDFKSRNDLMSVLLQIWSILKCNPFWVVYMCVRHTHTHTHTYCDTNSLRKTVSHTKTFWY